MDTASHPAALDITLLCRLRAAVQWLETPRPLASNALDLADLMSAVAPVVDGVATPRTEADFGDPLKTLAVLHGYYAADPAVAAGDRSLLTETLSAARGVFAAAFAPSAVA